MNILLNWIKPNLNFWIDFWIEFFGEKSYWIIFWIECSWKKWYWIIPWIEFYREMNEWIIFWIDICHFWSKFPFFVYFGHSLGIFGHFSYSTSINDSLTIELNIFWIESPEFILNYILNWILGKAILNRIWNESFLAKFKHWIESDWVSPTPIPIFDI